MGILEKWTKKKTKEQLEAVESGVVVVDKEKSTTKSKETTKKVQKQVSTKGTKGKVVGSAYRVLIRPVISEKAATQEVRGVYTFIVENNVSKDAIKKAVEQVYGVRPAMVRTVNYEGKQVRFGYRKGRRSDWKKAIVTLPKGHTIHIHEGV